MRPFPAIALITFASSLGAQNTPAPTPPAASSNGRAQIVGVVIDSVDGRYLAGADIVIERGRPALRTDSLGKFKVDSLPPGTYQVGVFHPLLDTLGITLKTQPIHVGPDSASFVLLAVPSASTLIRRSCSVQSRAPGASAVIGHVTDPETLEPIAGAEVSIAWTDLDIAKGTGIRRTVRVVRDTTNASGAFQICGLPNSLRATLQARHGSAVTAEIPIVLGDRPVELLARTVFLSVAGSRTKSGNAAVSGLVVLEGSSTNAGSRVELEGTDIVATTNDRGEFTMANVPPGTMVLHAVHLGFDAETVPVDLMSGEHKQIAIKLRKFVPAMEPVLVTARRSAALEKVGFTQRRKKGFGFYLGPEILDNFHATFLTDILRQVPGLYLIRTARGDVLASSHAPGVACVQYYLDDAPYMEVTPGDIQKFVSGGEVVAVEVYQGIVPMEYSRAGISCITIVIWTRYKIRG